MSMERASTSFPRSTPEWKYDVFLSFRGDDTRKGFTDHLYAALDRHGIITFKDDPELQKGKPISPELFAAIEESRFALVVLSENYASSTWCLEELVKILECMEARATVLPIFYDVSPSDVRKQTGSFTVAFTKHEEKLKDDKEKVQTWKDALTKVANFSGWDSQCWYESMLIKDIVETIWKKLRPTCVSHVDELVGIDSRLQPIHFLLEARSEEVCFIGVWGMGGIGKSTIARLVYERISHEFEVSIFLADVRRNFEKNGLPYVQKQLLSMMVTEKGNIWDIHEGATMIRRFLRHRKVLLILDDVNHLDQLEYLAGNGDWFGFGSIVLITTRYEHLLIKHGVERRFEVKGLNDGEALRLFSWRAFKKDYPEPSFAGLCNRVLYYAGGVPLVLKVLGSFLHRRNLSVWDSALDKLSEVCNSEILETLKISYDDLEYDEKKIFLDIACFWYRKDKDRVRELLDACGFYAEIGIDVLVERCLVNIESDGTLQMHGLLQQMGREIVRQESPDEPGRRSRLWLRKDIVSVLRRDTGTEAIEGIIMPQDGSEEVTRGIGVIQVNAQSFSMMKRLRYLTLNSVNLSTGLEQLPNSLRILDWSHFPLKSLPLSFNPEDLRELYMRHSRLVHIKPFKSLKIIDLSHSLNLVKTPDFRGIPFLEHLILEGCTRLQEIDPSVMVLQRLTLMNLKDCKNLARLPSSLSGLKSLKVLNVFGCSKLRKLPEDLGYVECLEELDVSGTALREPPSSLGLLQDLKRLSLGGCSGQSSNTWMGMIFPFSSLSKISPNPTVLWLSSLSGVQSLTKLNLSGCNLLDGAIADELGRLSSLTELDLSNNPIVCLPTSISQLSQLRILYTNDCQRLQTLSVVRSSTLVRVEASNCSSLETAGRDIARLFTNCFKKVEEQHNVHAEYTGSKCDIIVPGDEIPKWFDHQSVGFSIGVELKRGWLTDKLIGIALSAVVFRRPDGDAMFCHVWVNGDWTEMFRIPLSSWFNDASPDSSDHLWLCFLPRDHPYLSRDVCVPLSTRLVFEFSSIDSRVEVKKCGVHLVYNKDVEALMKQMSRTQSSGVSIVEEALEFPSSDSEISDDREGPSEIECESACVDGPPLFPTRLRQLSSWWFNILRLGSSVEWSRLME